MKVSSPESITGYTNCQGDPITTPYVVNNSEGPSKPEAFTLYNGTTQSINVFYAHLEQTLIALEFLDPDNPKQLMRRLRRLFGRVRPDQNEINILRGILTAAARKRG